MFKKSLLAAAIVIVGIFAFGLSHAALIDGMHSGNGPQLPATLQVFVNPGALGDALIYGYYNARNEFNFLRVINTSQDGVVAKVRFREGRNSNEVLDFFICLSGFDQWSAWVVGDANTSNPATLLWYDNDTPTWPDPQNDDDATNNFLATQVFHFSSTGASAVVTADDTKEGYFEIIALGSWTDTPGSTKVIRTPKACAQVLGFATETACGPGTAYPEGCGIIPTGMTDARIFPPANVLAGNHVIFDIASLKGTFAYNATALGDCIQAVITSPSLGTEGIPTLKDCQGSTPAVDFVLTKTNEYVLYDIESSLVGNTDFVNTFPTRRDSIQFVWGANNGFNGPFDPACRIDSRGEVCTFTAPDTDCTGSTKKACCVTTDVKIFDDEENSPQTTGFSPGTTTKPKKCFDVNYATVGTTKTPLLNTALQSFKIDASSFQIGWVRENFVQTPQTAFTSFPNSSTPATVFTRAAGMPVISYELAAFVDGFWSYMLPLRYDVTSACFTLTSINPTVVTPAACAFGQ